MQLRVMITYNLVVYDRVLPKQVCLAVVSPNHGGINALNVFWKAQVGQWPREAGLRVVSAEHPILPAYF